MTTDYHCLVDALLHLNLIVSKEFFHRAVHFPTQNFACTRFCDKLMQEIPEVKQATARFNDFFIGWFGENPETMKTIVGSKITRFYRG
ncbi:unnamed protein product [Brassica oleracea]